MTRGMLQLLLAAGIAGTCLVADGSAQSLPLSGRWTGTVVANGSGGERFDLVFALTFDHGRVSGTAGPSADNQNGAIDAGTYDPATGAIKLEIDVKEDDGRTGRAVFDGRLVDRTALGTFTFDNRTGRFVMTKDSGAGTGQAGGMDPAVALKEGFAEVSGWLLRAADMVPPEKYTYRPAPTVRTFGELLGHVVDGYRYFCGRASGQPVDWSDATAQGKTDKAVIVAALKSATDACTAAHKGAGAGLPLLISNYGHTSLHYGNVVTYMRMLGLVPPSSQP